MKYFNFFVLPFALALLIGCDAKNKKLNTEAANPTNTTKKMTVGDTVEQLMPEDNFWEIIDKSRVASGNIYQVQIESLKQILAVLNPAEIVKFDNRFYIITGVFV
jgi:hypothetical protein